MQNVFLTHQFFLEGKCLTLNTVLSNQQKLPFEIVQLCVLTLWVPLSAPIAWVFFLGAKSMATENIISFLLIIHSSSNLV